MLLAGWAPSRMGRARAGIHAMRIHATRLAAGSVHIARLRTYGTTRCTRSDHARTVEGSRPGGRCDARPTSIHGSAQIVIAGSQVLVFARGFNAFYTLSQIPVPLGFIRNCIVEKNSPLVIKRDL